MGRAPKHDHCTFVFPERAYPLLAKEFHSSFLRAAACADDESEEAEDDFALELPALGTFFIGGETVGAECSATHCFGYTSQGHPSLIGALGAGRHHTEIFYDPQQEGLVVKVQQRA